MSPGILKLLRAIESRPSESKLIDRFMMLVHEGPEEERSAARTQLGKILVEINPIRAIEIVFQEYKNGISRAANVAIIIKALVALKMPDRSAIVRNEMMRYWDKQLSQDDRNLAQLAIEEQVGVVLSNAANKNLTLEGANPLVNPSISNDLSFSVDFGLGLVPNLGAVPALTEEIQYTLDETFLTQSQMQSLTSHHIVEPVHESEPMHLAEPSDNAETVQIARPVNIGAAVNIPEKKLGKLELISRGPTEGAIESPELDLGSMGRGDVRMSVSSSGAGIPEPISPPKVSQYAQKIQGGSLLVGKQMPQARGQIQRQSNTSIHGRENIVSQIEAGEWEEVLSVLEHDFSLQTDFEFLKGIFEQNKLERVDIRFAEWWIDILVECADERRAMRYIQQKLLNESNISWAQMCWPKVLLIRDRLELSHVEWDESEGVASLRRATFELKPRLLSYWIVPSKAS